MIEQYLERFTKSPIGICAKGACLTRMLGICGSLLNLLDAVDGRKIASVNLEDCVKAERGKASMMKRIEAGINQLHSNVNSM